MRFSLLLFLLLIAAPAGAVVLDFEDLSVGDHFVFGDVFFTNSVMIDVEPFQWSNGNFGANFSEVDDQLFSGGTGNDLEINNVNLDIEIPDGITSMSLLFGEYGGNLNVNVNGDFRNFDNFDDIDGLSIGGLAINVVALGDDTGRLELSGGTINLFKIGGQELWVDNIAIVPQPGTMVLLASGLAGLALASRRRFVQDAGAAG
ncbi:MAG: PEP-CTERM sorting domain-containing protein [Deltaproteobacteria bacterium]|nr:PEP-CTERM sorting domain-containing protein [Deltaproteobacteria bacterium]MBW2362652.1 PEP-CTERM sorting domain-containing protein [Deltaproteobacteria bacterium]